MLNKKLKRGIGIICMATGLLVGSMTTSAASYVESNMPKYPEISCRGSIGFSGNTMRATTSSNGGSKISWYMTSVTGVLTVNGKSLGVQSSSGTTSAVISGSGVNGYNYGNGTHQVHTGKQTWTGYTDM